MSRFLARWRHVLRPTVTVANVGLFSVVLTSFIANNVVDKHRVRGPSMAPSLSPDYSETGRSDWVVVTKLKPADNLKYGDVICYRQPHNPEEISVKRVIALPGDTVTPRKDYPVDKVKIPWGHVWVEGDNWRRTYDSNDYGPVSMRLIEGRVRWVVWPLNRVGEVQDKRTSKPTKVRRGEPKLPEDLAQERQWPR